MQKYSLNEYYFDIIDSATKAYWIGFIWGDGYILKRKRNNNDSYEFKLSLASCDKDQLMLFNKQVNSNRVIKYYEIEDGFKTNNKEARLYICNKYFVSNLYNNYGISPNRYNIDKILNKIPNIYYKDFIRGVIDADGCLKIRHIKYKKANREEFSLQITASKNFLDFCNEQLIFNKFTNTHYKQVKRHESKDGNVYSLSITGNNKVYSILKWLYENKKEISLNRKYERYSYINNYMIKYNKENKND